MDSSSTGFNYWNDKSAGSAAAIPKQTANKNNPVSVLSRLLRSLVPQSLAKTEAGASVSSS